VTLCPLTTQAFAGESQLPERPAVLPATRFFHVTEHRQTDPQPGEDADAAPPWFARAGVLEDDARPPPGSVRLPARQPLTRWSRLWPFLRRALGQTVESRQPDLPRVVDRLTRGEVLRSIPMHRRHGWSPRIVILADYNRQTQPFHGDFNSLCRALERRHGQLGLDRRVLASDPGRQPLVRRPLQSTTQRWQVPPAATPLLILSDLGLLDGAPETLRGWQQFAGRLRSAACPALVLCPVPAELHPASLQRCFEIVEWDRISRLRRSTAGAPPAKHAAERSAAAVEKLLTLLAAAVLVEPPLLRAIRHLLPAIEADVLAEAMVWQHPDVLAGAQGFQFSGLAAIEKYQSRFAQLTPDEQSAVVGLIVAHHAGLPESVRLAELATCRRLAPTTLPATEPQTIEQWQHAIARTAFEHGDSPGLQQWLRRHVGRQSEAMFADDDSMAALWALAQRERLARGEVIELPSGIRQEAVRFFLNPDPVPIRIACALRQRGQELRLEPLEMKIPGLPEAGSHYADLTLVDGGVFVRVTRSSATTTPAAFAGVYVAAAALPKTLARLTRDVERIKLHAAHLDLTVSAIKRPRWAHAIGRDAYGLFGEISVGGVSQRFRWIAPGRFLMGSPVDEPERDENEVPHEVTLSRGFWLADTACTQAFWRAVTGSNPSHFKEDPRNPVEQVSWYDVQAFIAELKRRLPGLPARLPTDAEWEYACRAGTTTPFSFGEKITPDLVNYDGSHPYVGGDKGLYRGKTVPVASLPPNAWGLYEMHGNVYEWCANYYAEYPTTPQIDPQGPQTGIDRVLRGGSWDGDGGHVRSANRFRYGPGHRYDYLGFRLAMDQDEAP
jgi:formylglycine-generating enzyme required for sulfatase activity